MTIQTDKQRLQGKLNKKQAKLAILRAKLIKMNALVEKIKATIQPLITTEEYLEAQLQLINSYIEAKKMSETDTEEFT